jgi:uncharacterized protein (TIGR02246 family)
VSATDASTASILERLQRLEDLQAIQQLFIDYGRHLDAGDVDAYAALFAEDGELMLGPVGRTRGRAAIREMLRKVLGATKGKSIHVISSPQVKLDGDRATSSAMWTVVATDADGKANLTMTGRHVDELRREPEGWRFVTRKGYVDIPAAMPKN